MRLTGMLAIIVATLAGAAVAGAPEVRLVEVGEDGVLFDGSIVVLDLDLAATEPFRGTLVAWLEHADAAEELERASLDLAIEPGTQRATIPFLLAPGRVGHLATGGVRWELRADDGSVVRSGAAKTQSTRGSPALFLTREPGAGVRRDPSRLGRVPDRLLGHEAIVVTGSNLAGLPSDALEALLDATSLGAKLIITPPEAPLPGPLGELAAESRIAWSDESGGSIREVRFGAGHVRFTTLSLEALASESSPWLTGLLLHPADLVPRFMGFTRLVEPRWGPHAAMPPGASTELDPTGAPPDLVRRARWAGSVGLAVISLLLVGLLVAARSLRWRLHGRALSISLGLLGLSIPLVGLVLARFSATQPLEKVIVTMHDADGRSTVRHTFVASKGSGGFAARAAIVDRPASFVATTPGMRGLLRWSLADETWRVEAAPVGQGVERQIDLQVTERLPGSRSWDADISWLGDQLVARLTPHEDFDSAVLVMGSTALPLGPVRAGVIRDVAAEIRALATSGRPERRAPLDWQTIRACHVGLDRWGARPPWGASDALAIVSRRGEAPLLVDVQPISGSGCPGEDRCWSAVGGFLVEPGGPPNRWQQATVELPIASGACDGSAERAWLHAGSARLSAMVAPAAIVSDADADDAAPGACRLELRDARRENWWTAATGVTRRTVTFHWQEPARGEIP